MNMFANDQGVPTPGATQAAPRRNMFAGGEAPAATVMQPDPQGAADPYHARAAEYLDNLDAQGKISTGGALNTFLHDATSGVANRAIALGHAGVGHMLGAGGEMPFKERLAYENALEDEKYRRASQGAGSTAAGIVGALVNPLNKLGGPLVSGAAQGAITGAMDSRTEAGALEGAGLGLAGGAVGKALGGVVNKGLAVANPAPRVAPAATAADLRAAAQAHYDRFENSGGTFTQEALKSLRTAMDHNLAQAGYIRGTNPTIEALGSKIDKMARPITGPVDITPRHMQYFRQAAGGLTESADPFQRKLGFNIRNAVDDTMTNASSIHGPFQPGVKGFHTQGGDVDVGALAEGNRLWRQLGKAETLERNIDKQNRAAAISGIGGNTVNTTRRAVNNTYNQLTKNGRKLTADEDAAFRTAIEGSTTENALRTVSRLGVKNNGLVNALHLAAAGALGPGYAVIPGIGALADIGANSAAKRSAEEVGRVIRAGGARRPMPQAPSAAQRMFNSEIAPRIAGPFAQIFANQLNPAPVRNK